ncbi:MAG: SIS domain-containing protein, partial [Planctomycetota bacterium]
MCGIFALLTDAQKAQAPTLEPLAAAVDRLLGFDPGEDDPASAVEAAGEVLKQSGLWVRPEGFLFLFGDPDTARTMTALVKRLEGWIGKLERCAGGEEVNRILIAGRDAAWQLKEDVLGNVPKVRALLPDAGTESLEPWRHAWALNLTLNNIDRLEVRGRDSAGLAAYVHFPSAGDLKEFLDQSDRRAGLEKRSEGAAFGHGHTVLPPSSDRTILFAFKVAEEVGEMGDNVRFLRGAISGDALFQAALRRPGVRLQVLGHTRWASNGVISLPNCHPVDGTVLDVPESRGTLVAALNGDIDNFQELFQKYVAGRGRAVDPGITTDAKIIPVVVAEHLKNSSGLEEAFAKAFAEFEGSMAISLMAADRPDEILCAKKGSGQGLFLGFAGDTVAAASEMYGVVELTPDYLKAEDEVFLLRTPKNGGVVHLPKKTAPEASRRAVAEITTRDINRGPYPRYLLKEISESVLSVEKTIRGKVDGKKGRTLLDESVLPATILEDLKSGRIRRILPIGQGTAAVAAHGVGHLLQESLQGAAIKVTPMKATELSGHHLEDDMSDCLVVAVSQSGTTTDTNRTVDLVRERGAFVIGIVNRRNSDLVYKSNGVLYTSDGRDVEMSVASTKAFYAQNVAGEILALAIAEALDRLSPEERSARIKALLELPRKMEKVLKLSEEIGRIASETVLRRRHWAVVGTGPGKIAADEIRIKLSELCYKSIAVDFIEDKKHIDLSSEPLVIVCASGLPPASVSDVVKEVAIFKAHRSLPVVFHDKGEKRFAPYAAHALALPKCEGTLGYLLQTMAGHLFGYHAASAFDREAGRIRKLRHTLVREMEQAGEELEGTELWRMLARSSDITEHTLEVQKVIDSGAVDGGLEVRTGARLSTLFDFLLGRVRLDFFRARFGRPGRVGSLLASLIEALSDAVNELCRPIDAIKHQAKTVTVGISRQVERSTEGPLWSVFAELGVDPARLT